MPKRLLHVLGAILLIASVTLVVWQGSFSVGSFAPDDPEQTFVFYGISILIVLLMVTLGFMLARLIIKLWIERSHDRPGSRISTKLVVGALALSMMPVFFMVLFNVYVLNRTMQKWFTLPEQHELVDLTTISTALERQTSDKANAEAELLALSPETKLVLTNPLADRSWLARFCQDRGILAATISPAGNTDGNAKPLASFGEFPGPEGPPAVVVTQGPVRLAVAVPVDVVQQRQAIEEYHRAFDRLSTARRATQSISLLLLILIALFVLFAASWLAFYLARQISAPISALLRAIEEVSKGNLGYRVKVTAVDELSQLVSGFNRMTGDLEANRTEIESRRRFTEAILESIPTGVISVDATGAIQLVNKALAEIFPDSHPRNAVRLEDLFVREDAAEIRYLMNRARRTGHASQQLEVKTPRRTLHLAVTVSAIEGRRGAGFVIVIEDTSDLLRAQKIAAWSEVARRVAHEIRNPLTPITLSAERIVRQIDRRQLNRQSPASAIDKVVRECAEIILDETASVKRLVDEFSQFSRLPAAQPVICDLNEVVANGITVFEGRLDGIEVNVDLAPDLPAVSIDPEQIKRVVVNLIDNAAEAMQDSALKVLTIQTRTGLEDTVDIIFADTGCGITAEQKEKLFLPYFSTKGRGTGLGLAIVSHILTEHNANIRVEDNKPCGAWFRVEIPIAVPDKQSAPVTTAALA
ncbi:MAG: ATP-binding protein [Bryobacteraceae bacterium]|jgi:PAS domain S-box-containing protein